MALPAKAIAWTYSLCNRIPFNTSVNQTAADVMYFIANYLINPGGFGFGITCKGSSTGTVAAMDGVFRWTSGNDAKTASATGSNAAQSWVAFTLSGGRGDVVFSYNKKPGSSAMSDDVYSVWWSPTGVATAQATPTWEPTATDKVTMNTFFVSASQPGSTIIGSATSGDRLVSIWAHERGFRVAVAAGNSWQSLWGVTPHDPDQYGPGITVRDCIAFYQPGVADANWSGGFYDFLNLTTNTNTSPPTQFLYRGYRVDGGGTRLDLVGKTKVIGWTSGTPNVSHDLGFRPELQGGASYLMKRFGVYSMTTGHAGDVGTLMDWYLSRSNIGDGDSTGSLEWVCVDNVASTWWPWDGVTPVVMS